MNHKLIMCILIMMFNLGTALPQQNMGKKEKSYHLLYIDISRTKERKDLTDRLMNLINEIRLGKDDFLVYLSNGYRPEILYSQRILDSQIEELTSQLQTLNTSSPILMFDKDTLLSIWDENDIIEMNERGSLELMYNSVYFHFFISSELFKVQEKELIDRFLIIKNLTKKHIDPSRIVIDILFSKNDSKAFTERKLQLTKNNWTGYNYLFTAY